jgi:hypothetical protein
VDQEREMEIIRLPVGEQASVDDDCLRIEEQADSSYRLTASALCAETDDAESASIVGAPSFRSLEEAEAAGVTWAATVGVERLVVTSGTLERPLKLIEIDSPL